MKKFLSLLSTFLLVTLLSAYTYPKSKGDTFYVELRDSRLGNITLYIPYNPNYKMSLDKKNNQIINVSNTSLYAYAGDIRITFPQFDLPYYSSGTSTYTLNIQEIISYNLPLGSPAIDSIYRNVIVISCVLFIAFNLFGKRR